jgi:hypothetical protein
MTSGPDFRQTWLWRQAFESPRTDATSEEQEYFRTQYSLLRDKAAQLVNRIAVNLPGMTVHDVTHLDALWDMASLVAEGAISLNPAEAYVFGAAVLLHDAAMSLAAYPGGMADVRKTVVWQDAVARRSLEQKERGKGALDPHNLPTDVVNGILPDVLRRLHAQQAEKLAEQAWEVNGAQIHLIDDPDLRAFYGPVIGQVAHSHWWSVQKVETELAGDLGAFPQRTRNLVDKVKIACLLRVADALHLDSRRAPRFIRAITKPTGFSELHWAFQERLARPHIELDTIVYTTGQPFDRVDADAWWLAFDTINMVDAELNDVDQLLRGRGREVLRARRVQGAGSPEMLSRTVKTRDWRPVDARLQVSDVPRIVETLGGAKLYGDDPTVPLRELIQNGADAVQARRRLEDREDDWGQVTVAIDQRGDGAWLTVEDNGIGMSELVLTGPLLDFGTSFWRSPLAMEEFPGLMAAGMQAVGRFGIGFFSVFMLGAEVRVYTRRSDRGTDHGRLLEFRGGTSSRPILSTPDPKLLPRDGGTRIEVRLKHAPESERGLLSAGVYSKKSFALSQLVAALAPNLAVALKINDGKGLKTVAQPGDWLKIPDARLTSRLNLSDTANDAEQGSAQKLMRILKTADGRIVGRAAINCEPRWGFRSTAGWVTVAGLRATRMTNVSGVLLGEALTAARDAARPVIDAPGLAAWATEQAGLIAQHFKDEEAQARGAEVVLGCGGDIGPLKIIKLGQVWLDQHELREHLELKKRIDIGFKGDFTYEEDGDDVLPREFRDDFKLADDVAIVPDHDGSIVSGGAMNWPRAKESASSDSQLAAFVRKIIEESFGEKLDTTDLRRSVGVVGWTEIEREVDVYWEQVSDQDD